MKYSACQKGSAAAPSVDHPSLPVPLYVIAIPAKNEEQVIRDCLLALAYQRDCDFTRMGVVLVVNNSSDLTAIIARSMILTLPYRLDVHEIDLTPPHRHVGMARKIAMDIAADWIGAGDRGFIFTTDADSVVSPNWLSENMKAFRQGADAVAGAVSYDQCRSSSPAFLRRRSMESLYDSLLAEVAARLDPEPHNPWPCHRTESGASLAIRVDAYRTIGGLPPVPVGEDRALCKAVTSRGLHLRHEPRVEVQTSSRLTGRAEGGAADTLRRRYCDSKAPCDDRLIEMRVAIRRATQRRDLRHQFRHGPPHFDRYLGRGLGLSKGQIDRIKTEQSFPAIWSLIEDASPVLTSKMLRPVDLPGQILLGKMVVRFLRLSDLVRPSAAERPDGTSPSIIAD
ncbi:MAG: glycosyltransferase [Dongiaceae bacterium]